MSTKKVFDWLKAAEWMRYFAPVEAAGGLKEQWYYTAVTIWKNGEIHENSFRIPVMPEYTPTLTLKLRPEGRRWSLECWIPQSEAPAHWFDEQNKLVNWPPEARLVCFEDQVEVVVVRRCLRLLSKCKIHGKDEQ